MSLLPTTKTAMNTDELANTPSLNPPEGSSSHANDLLSSYAEYCVSHKNKIPPSIRQKMETLKKAVESSWKITPNVLELVAEVIHMLMQDPDHSKSAVEPPSRGDEYQVVDDIMTSSGSSSWNGWNASGGEHYIVVSDYKKMLLVEVLVPQTTTSRDYRCGIYAMIMTINRCLFVSVGLYFICFAALLDSSFQTQINRFG
jgi:hypothetical protein